MPKIYFTILILSLIFSIRAAHSLTLVQTHPSDPAAFTQGFEYMGDDRAVLATGLYGRSSIGILNVKTGEYTIKDTLPRAFFGEGITQTPYGIWQLTWRENVAFLRDADDFAIVDTAYYGGEGWGLAYRADQDIIYMSNGSSTITVRDAKTFKIKSRINVHHQGANIEQLNELEFANGFIYANIWQSNLIAKIDPNTGKVVKFYDVSNLLANADISDHDRQNMDVLNGIARIEGNRFYVTGKFYPMIFEVTLD